MTREPPSRWFYPSRGCRTGCRHSSQVGARSAPLQTTTAAQQALVRKGVLPARFRLSVRLSDRVRDEHRPRSLAVCPASTRAMFVGSCSRRRAARRIVLLLLSPSSQSQYLQKAGRQRMRHPLSTRPLQPRSCRPVCLRLNANCATGSGSGLVERDGKRSSTRLEATKRKTSSEPPARRVSKSPFSQPRGRSVPVRRSALAVHSAIATGTTPPEVSRFKAAQHARTRLPRLTVVSAVSRLLGSHHTVMACNQWSRSYRVVVGCDNGAMMVATTARLGLKRAVRGA